MWILLVWLVILMWVTLYVYNNIYEEETEPINCMFDRFSTVHICSDIHLDTRTFVPIIDSTKVSSNWRILLIGQDDKTQNGVYDIGEYEMKRTSDANTPDHYQNGKSVYILHGKHYGGSLQTVVILENVAPDKESFKGVKFIPKIMTMTKGYKEGSMLRKDGTWVKM